MSPVVLRRGAVPALVFAAGLLVQGAAALGPLAPRAPFLKYPLLAERFLAGDLDPERLLDLSVLYFYLHVAVRSVSGSPELLVRLLQVAAVALAATLLYGVARRLVSRGAALAAAGVFLCERTVTVYTPILEPEILLTLAVVAFVAAALDDEGARPALAGAALAAALLLRPTLAPLAVLAPLWLVLRAGDRRRGVRRAAWFLLPVVLALGGLWARNAALPVRFSPTVMNPGAVFFEGNHPWASGLTASYPPLFADLLAVDPESPDPQHALYRLVARREAGRELSVAEVNRVWRRRAAAFLADHPGAAVGRAVKRLGEVFRAYAWHDLENAYWRERRLASSFLPAAPFALVASFGLLGMALVARDWRRWLPLYAVAGCQLAVMTVAYVSARQKLALVPILVVFAVAAGERIARRGRAWKAILAAAVALGALLWLPTDASREDRHLWEGLRQSNELRREALELRAAGNLDRAARAAARALALTPWRHERLRPAGVPFGLQGFAGRALAELDSAGLEPTTSRTFDEATLALAAGELDRAESILTALTAAGWRGERGSYGSSEPRVLLARVVLGAGDRRRAVELAAAGLARAPGDPEALALLAALAADEDAARDLERYYGPVQRAFFVGRAALAAGDAERAVEELGYVVAVLPELRRARISLAAALGAAGRAEEGARLFLAATATIPEPLLLEREIVTLFEQWADEAPDDAERAAPLERVRRLYGRIATPVAEP